MRVYFPRAAPQVWAPNRPNNHFSHLQVNGHFEQTNFKTPYVPDGCTYWSNILGRGNQEPKVCFGVIFDDGNFGNFYSLIVREFSPIWAFWDAFSQSHKVCYRGKIWGPHKE